MSQNTLLLNSIAGTFLPALRDDLLLFRRECALHGDHPARHDEEGSNCKCRRKIHSPGCQYVDLSVPDTLINLSRCNSNS